MSNPLIIKGAIYKDGDELVRPHYTGEYYMVDCTEYKTIENIVKEYDIDFAKNVVNSKEPLLHDDVEYYECEYSPHITEGFELLSDIYELCFYDHETSF